jgi:hypothetical protein
MARGSAFEVKAQLIPAEGWRCKPYPAELKVLMAVLLSKLSVFIMRVDGNV